jgi:hypothetical protein
MMMIIIPLFILCFCQQIPNSRNSTKFIIDHPCPMNLSFAGCGFLGVYHLGVAKCLVDHAPQFLRSIKAFAGASAGSLAAAMLATSAPINKCSDYVVELTNEARKNPFGPFSRQFDLVGNLRKGMEELLPSNCHKIASGRLFISVTSLKTRKNYMISEYESKDELMKVKQGLKQTLYEWEPYVTCFQYRHKTGCFLHSVSCAGC